MIPGVFWVGKFGRYFLGGLILVGIFEGIQSNLKIHGSARISRLCATNTIIQFLIYFWCYIIILMLSGKFKGRGNQHGILGGLIFDPGIFWALLEDQGILPRIRSSPSFEIRGIPLGSDPRAPNFSIRKVDKLISK